MLAEVDAPGDLPLAPWDGELAPHPLRLPWAEPGGPARDLAWAAGHLRAAGLRPAGRPEQVRTWNLSSLWRLPLEDGAAWLKCVPPFFAHEGAVLARLAGGPVPPLLAHEPGRVLMREIPGEDHYDAPLPVLEALVRLLVDLQVQEVGHDDELLALGLPDWRGPALAAAVEDVVRRHADGLADDDRRSLDALLQGLDRRWADLAACGLPDTLVHGDVHPGNARGDGERLVLMDWGDCGVGHPLLDQPAMLDRIDPALGRRRPRHLGARLAHGRARLRPASGRRAAGAARGGAAGRHLPALPRRHRAVGAPVPPRGRAAVAAERGCRRPVGRSMLTAWPTSRTSVGSPSRCPARTERQGRDGTVSWTLRGTGLRLGAARCARATSRPSATRRRPAPCSASGWPTRA